MLRWMGRQPGFTAAASLTLALGIGANTAIFSVVYGVLLKPLPYADPDRLVRVSEEHPGANSPLPEAFLSDVTLESWARGMRMLEGVAAYNEAVYTVGREDPVRLPGGSVSPSLFRLLRVSPTAGRFFEPGEDVEGADGVVVLSHGLWRKRFGGNPAAVGQSIFIDGRFCRIVGVAPQSFAFPASDTELWMPHVIPARTPEQRGMHIFTALARLKPGVTPLQAAAEGTAAARAVPRPMTAEMLFGKGQPVEVRVRPMIEQMTSGVRPAFLVLAVGVGLVLLIACANVSNLILSRSVGRQRELAVRAALGAGRRRLARQLLTENLVLSLLGGALGVLLAWGLVRAVPVLAPEDLPRLEEVQLDGRVLAFAVAASILAGLLSGLVPAWRGMRIGPAPVLHDGDSRATSGAGKRLRSGLLVAEAALAVVLLIGAGLMIRSFVRLLQVDGGFEPDNVLSAQLILPDGEEPQQVRNQATAETLLARLQALPGVVVAGAANMAPFGNSTSIMGFTLPPSGSQGEQPMIRANVWVVTPGFGRALGLRVKSGRFFQASDLTAGTQSIVVNEEFVRMFLTDGKPVVGRRYTGILSDDENLITEIVGVVGNVLKDGLDRLPQPEIYFPAGFRDRKLYSQPFLLVRTAGDPLQLTPDLRRLLHEVEPRAALDDVDSLTGKLSASVAQPRFAALVLAVFAALALILAAIGLYGVLSYGVSQRRREMGVRAALGATQGGLLRLVLREGLVLTVAGLALGLGASAGVTRLMQSLLFGVTPLDTVAFVTAPLALLVVAVVACLVPARRAAAIDPAEALRE